MEIQRQKEEQERLKKEAAIRKKNRPDSFKQRAESIKKKYTVEELPEITEHNSVSEF